MGDQKMTLSNFVCIATGACGGKVGFRHEFEKSWILCVFAMEISNLSVFAANSKKTENVEQTGPHRRPHWLCNSNCAQKMIKPASASAM